MRLDDAELACGRGHSFDVARQGYVNLRAGPAGPGTAGTADTAAMVAARVHFLGRGHYRPIAESVRSLAVRYDRGGPGLAVDLAGGTGYYLAEILDGLRDRDGAQDRDGLCVDLSVPALRRAARAHPRAAAVAADVWHGLPLADDSATLVVSVFGPRNAAETDRILRPDGTLLIATPGVDHLQELRQPLGMIGVDPGKPRRLAEAFGSYETAEVTPVSYRLSLDHEDLTALVAMGPSAHHITPPALAARVRELPEAVTVTVDLQIRAFRRGRAGGR